MRLLYPFFYLLFAGFPFFLHAQPIPCEEPPEMTSFCVDACIICDIDGFSGRHESDITGEAPPGFCTFTVHNGQWIAFIAGSTDLQIQLSVSNCDMGFGLEVGIYEGIDCDNFELVSNCRGAMEAVKPGNSGIFTVNKPLTIGQYYFLVMDGARGDNCDWEFTVLEGSTLVAPLTNSGEISGPQKICPEQLHNYTLTAPNGATDFEWSINGVNQTESGLNLEYTFPTDGVYNICVTASNACDEGPPTCYPVTVESIPITQIVETICEGDCYDVADTSLCDSGFYQFDLLNFEGCDSIVRVDLTELVTPMINVDVDICDGDTLFIGNTPYPQTGLFQEVLQTQQGCDSIVNLDLFVIVCNIRSIHTSIPVICYGEASGQINFEVEFGSPPFSYSWENLEGTLSGLGNITALGESIQITGLPAGTYLITVDDGFGNFDIIIQDVQQPDPLTYEFLASDYNGYNLTCSDAQDGTLEIQMMGGVPAYSYIWDGGLISNNISGLGEGTYQVTVTDDSGCSITDAYEIVGPEPLDLVADFSNPNCDGLNTGQVTVLSSTGGTSPYSFSLNGNSFSTNTTYDSLFEGNYSLTLQDANGCETSSPGILVAPQIPVINLGNDFNLNLGDLYTFDAILNNINLKEIIWTSSDSLSCTQCLNPSVVPFNSGQYTLTVLSEDDCPATDSIFITVDKFRQFYVPSAFSPNFDGFNDFFTIYGGQEVEVIESLIVFDRWGAVIFEKKEFAAGKEPLGWDGTVEGKVMNPGIYVWTAKIRFIDGVRDVFSGDINIVY